MTTKSKDRSTATTITFKSVGEKLENIRNAETEQPVTVKNPIGIATPLEMNKGDLFKMHYSLADQVTDNLRNLILTNRGERLGNPAFGAGLSRIQYDVANKEEAELRMMAAIQDACKKFMPFVNLIDFTTTQLPPSLTNQKGDLTDGYPGGALVVRITFAVAQAFKGTRGLQMVLPMGV